LEFKKYTGMPSAKIPEKMARSWKRKAVSDKPQIRGRHGERTRDSMASEKENETDTYDHKSLEVRVNVEHGNETVSSTKGNDVLASHDRHHGGARVLGEDLGSKARRGDENVDERELINGPSYS
jgi:hypothetical protein